MSLDNIKPVNLKKIEVQVRTLRPGITRYTFKNFEDMGNYFQSRIEEFEARNQRVVCVGIAMFVFDKKGA